MSQGAGDLGAFEVGFDEFEDRLTDFGGPLGELAQADGDPFAIAPDDARDIVKKPQGDPGPIEYVAEEDAKDDGEHFVFRAVRMSDEEMDESALPGPSTPSVHPQDGETEKTSEVGTPFGSGIQGPDQMSRAFVAEASTEPAPAPPPVAATSASATGMPLIVDTLADVVDANDGFTSLREAIALANANADHDDIVFADGLSGTIRLTQGELAVTEAAAIDGGGVITISGDANGDDVTDAEGITQVTASGSGLLDDNDRVFRVDADGDVALSGLVVTGGVVGLNYLGGGVAAYGTSRLTIGNVRIEGNYAGLEGGGVSFQASATGVFDQVTIADNVARIAGGGIVGAASGTDIQISNSMISGNVATVNSGGGLQVAGSLNIDASRISGNSAAQGRGGAVEVEGSADATISNSIIDGSTALNGGGVNVSGDLRLESSTLYGNSAAGANGSGGGGVRAVSAGDVDILNATFFENSASAGGAIFATGTPGLLIANATIVGNSADQGSGVSTDPAVAGAPYTTIANSIILGNVNATNGAVSDAISGRFSSQANLIGGDVARVFADLDVNGAPILQDNGGPVPTIALLGSSGNPALDAATGIGSPVDARGLQLIDLLIDRGGFRDLGAFELTEEELGLQPALPNLTVTTLADVVDPADGEISLREALDRVSFADDIGASPQTVTFVEGLEGTIRLTQGELVIARAITIDGGGVITITGDANGDDVTDANGLTDVADSARDGALDDNSRILNIVDAPSEVVLIGLTITGGRTTGYDPSSQDRYSGGGISSNAATLTIADSTISGNSTTGNFASGGGLYSSGGVTLINSTVSGNSTSGDNAEGGGIDANVITVASSRISDNSTYGRAAFAGGIDAGTVTVTNSTVSGNSTAGFFAGGGGIRAIDVVTLTNSTISGNATAGDTSSGGGVFAAYDVTVISSTISGNSTAGSNADGGGIVSFGAVAVANSIILGNTAELSQGDEVIESTSSSSEDGVPEFLGFNIVGADSGAFDASISANVSNADPNAVFAAVVDGAGVLADNGGPVETIALSDDPLNPALDASGGDNIRATDARGVSAFDQVGVGAEGAGNPGIRDLGAFEVDAQPEAASLIVTTLDDVVDRFDGLTSLREAVAFANEEAGAA
ncbi:MAG: choice-of-anchor Q domain-containing protein, partial [Pseudomonadota bacterium]